MRISFAKVSRPHNSQSDGSNWSLPSGLATIDKSCRYANAYPQVLSSLKEGVFYMSFLSGRDLMLAFENQRWKEPRPIDWASSSKGSFMFDIGVMLTLPSPYRFGDVSED
jgi:hypothetical protein